MHSRLAVEALEDRQAPAVLTVNSTLDTATPTDPYLSLREAIAIFNSPTLPSGLSAQILAQISGTLHGNATDRIVIDPVAVTGSITLSGSQLDSSLPGSMAQLTIDGGTGGVTVDGNNSSRVLQVDAGVQATLVNLTITHGKATDVGGGIRNLGTLALTNSTLSANSATYGAIYNDSGTLTLTNCTIQSNSAAGAGGGLFNNSGRLTLTGSTVSSNSANFGQGGGIYSANGLLTVTDSVLSANSSRQSGGGIFSSASTVMVTNSMIRSNSTGYVTGGIDNEHGALTATSSTFQSNQGAGLSNTGTATINGSTFDSNSGGIDNTGAAIVTSCTFSANYTGLTNRGVLTLTSSTISDSHSSGIDNSGTLTVTSSTISSNSAFATGGGINNSGMLTVTSSTITGNSANAGGGIYNSSASTLSLQNTIVAGNSSANFGPDISGSVQGGSGYNLIGIADGSLFGISNGLGGNLVGSPDAPIDPRLGPLGDNGGATRTQALLPDSPARGAGSVTNAPDTDQRGLPRVVGGQIDLGSFETQTGVAGPQVMFAEPTGIVDPLIDHVRLTFNHPLDPATLNTGSFSLSGPAGVILVSGVPVMGASNGQQIDVSFPSQTQPGSYVLTVGSGLHDVYGSPLANQYTTRFIVAGTGSTLTVNSTADTANPTDPYLSLREAITIVNSPTVPTGLSPQILAQISGTLHANGSDRIVFDPASVTGPITLGHGQLELSLSRTVARVTIDGGSGITVDGNSASRVLQVDGGVQATLAHLTITHGKVQGSGSAAYGGGIFNSGTLTVVGSTISASSAIQTSAQGGGIYNSGILTVANSTISSNDASISELFGTSGTQGGGIYNRGGLTVTNSTFSSNGAAFGGGISNQGTLTVTWSTLRANGANRGGGIYTSGILTVANSTISGNGASGGGLPGFTFGGQGGGISNSGTATISNCTLSANSASTGPVGLEPSSGGAIDNAGSLTVTSSTITANSAPNGGGIITIRPATLLLQNTIVAGNRAIYAPDVSATLQAASSYNLIGVGPVGGISDGSQGNRVGTSTNPLDPLLGPLATNDSPPHSPAPPTQTSALLAGSPAIGNGDPTLVNTLDQRGFVRALPVSIGAYQPGTVVGTALTLTAPAIVAYGQSVTFTVTVSNRSSPVPGVGTVTLTDGSATLATVNVNANGQAVYTTSTLGPVGSQHTVTAVYNPDPAYASTTATTTVTVIPAPLLVKADNQTRAVGQPNPSFTWTVTGLVNGDTVGSVLSGALATTATASSTAGSYPITQGSLVATANYALAFVNGTLTVTALPTSTRLVSSLNPSPAGQPITFTSTVSSPGGVPSGMVSFQLDGSPVGSVMLSGGQASLAIAVSVGQHTVNAAYPTGDTFAGSSDSVSQVVNLAATTTRLVSSRNPSSAGHPVTFTATVTSAESPPGGLVTFQLDGAPAGVAMLTGGQASLAIAVPPGQHTVIATYPAGPLFSSSSDSVRQVVAGPQTVGVYDPGTATWYLRNSDSPGAPDLPAFGYGLPGWLGLVGDWNGDSVTTVGAFDPSSATFYLRNANSAGAADAGAFAFGLPGWLPLAGDWSGSRKDSIGVFDPATATWYLRNSNSAGAPDAGAFQYGIPGWIPVVGKWDGKTTGIGVVDPSSGTWYLRRTATPGAPDFATFGYGVAGWRPVVGDWGGSGHSGVGMFDPASSTWYLRDSASSGAPDHTPFSYGAGSWQPLAGVWVGVGSAQRATATGAPGAAEPLRVEQLGSVVASALKLLQQAGVPTGTLAKADFQVAGLPAGLLAQTVGSLVTVDPTAQGLGWYASTEGDVPAGRYDLLTVVLDELGNVAGVAEGAGSGRDADLMTELLAPGVRRTDHLDAVFSQLR
jgi:hypothetical protein